MYRWIPVTCSSLFRSVTVYKLCGCVVIASGVSCDFSTDSNCSSRNSNLNLTGSVIFSKVQMQMDSPAPPPSPAGKWGSKINLKYCKNSKIFTVTWSTSYSPNNQVPGIVQIDHIDIILDDFCTKCVIFCKNFTIFLSADGWGNFYQNNAFFRDNLRKKCRWIRFFKVQTDAQNRAPPPPPPLFTTEYIS